MEDVLRLKVYLIDLQWILDVGNSKVMKKM